MMEIDHDANCDRDHTPRQQCNAALAPVDAILPSPPVDLGPLIKSYGGNNSRLSSWFTSALPLNLHEFGFSYGSPRQEYAFSNITAIWNSLVQKRYYGVPTTLNHAYTFELEDGQRLTLRDDVAEIEEVSGQIAARVYERLLPEFAAAIRGGSFADFGPIAISHQQMICYGDEIPWTDIAGVRIRAGKFEILRTGRKWRPTWKTAMVAEIPNIPILVALVSEFVPIVD